MYQRLFSRGPAEPVPLFRALSLDIPPGEVVALIGSNGSGKTSLMKMAAGLLTPQSGEVWVGDRKQPHIRREQVGIMLGNGMLYDGLTGRQNLTYTAHLYHDGSAAEAVERAITRWGLESYADSPASDYSAGMKARLALARATLHDPALVLLDEPTVFLDADGLNRLDDYFRRRRGTATFLVTTQQLERLSQHVDRALTVDSLNAA